METELEWMLTNSYKTEMISFLSTHPEYFEEAIQLAITDRQPYSWRAAWLLWSCMEKNDQRVQGHIKDLIDCIPTKNDNQQREIFLILQKMELDEELEGVLFNICLSVWEKIDKKPSVRLNALKLLIKIAQKYPGLSQEIVLLSNDQFLESLSPGVKKSIAQMIKVLG
jgi:hypothetical protein